MSLTSSARTARRLVLQAAALAGSLFLVSCGGGGLVEPFVPTRILALGDELSVIQPDGRKYTVNAFKQVTANGVTTEDPNTIDCTRNPLWIQAVATSFGLAFDNCLGTATAASGQILATPGHKVADLPAQIAAVSGAPLGDKDIALVMIGMHDILELYASYPTVSKDALLAEARVRGASLGAQINQLAQSGPAVVLLTVPDIGLSPFALAQNTSTGDSTRSTLISELVAAFNNRTSVALINDGRLIGLVYADIELQRIVKFPSFFGLTNVVAAACRADAPLPNCTSATLVDTATATTWLWADQLLLGPTGQARLGALAEIRARGNPFN